LLPSERLLANVEGAMNAVVVQGDAVGTTLYYGKGAGGEPTASAVIADLVDVARAASCPLHSRVPALAFQPHAIVETPVLAIDDVMSAYYLRLRVSDQAGVLANLTGLLAKRGISIDAVLQREAHDVSGQEGNQTDLIMLTHIVREGALLDALQDIQALPSVLATVVILRKEELA
jgi:homoserine dehydrogenase